MKRHGIPFSREVCRGVLDRLPRVTPKGRFRPFVFASLLAVGAQGKGPAGVNPTGPSSVQRAYGAWYRIVNLTRVFGFPVSL